MMAPPTRPATKAPRGPAWASLVVATEVVAMMKTTEDSYWLFEARLKELHPYEVPEIVAFRASSGLPAYLRWVDESCLPERA